MAKCTNVGNFGEKGWKTDRNMVKHGERIMEIWVKHGKQKCWKTRNISEKWWIQRFSEMIGKIFFGRSTIYICNKKMVDDEVFIDGGIFIY